MKILAIGAHPDDLELGCFGTLQKLKAEGHSVEEFVIGYGRGHELDNKFDTKPLMEWAQIIEGKLELVKPDMVFTHCANDVNIDHRVIHQATLVATRPMKEQSVKEIYGFEVLSSTEWNFPVSFSPNVFYDITKYLDAKKSALKKFYGSEMREYPHPRSYRGVEVLAQMRGMQVGCEYAEAFELVRIIRRERE